MGRALRPAVLVAVFAACGGTDVRSAVPGDQRPRLQLLHCTSATPLPVLADDGVSFGGLTKAETLQLRRAKRSPQSARGSQVVLGAATMLGAFDRVVLARVLGAQLPSLRACYERELTKTGSVTARLDVSFTIESDGRVFGVSPGLRTPPELGQCVTRVVSGLRFPAPPGGVAVRVSYPVTFDGPGPGSPTPAPTSGLETSGAPVPELPTSPWTPFALAGGTPLAVAPILARITETAVRQRLDRVAACFPAPAPTGSLRILLELDPGGELRGVRVGGLGDPASEACLRRAFVGLHVLSPTLDGSEVACDLSRGDAQRFRVTPANYEVITTTALGMSHGGQTFELGASEPEPLPANRTYLILLRPETPGTVLELALGWAYEGDATLIATERRGAPPVLIGVGRSTFALGDAHDPIGALDVSLEVTRDRLTACVGSTTDDAALAEPRAIDALLARLAERCRKETCASTLGLAVEGGATADRLVTVVDAIRRAGFERALIGGGVGCRAASVSP